MDDRHTGYYPLVFENVPLVHGHTYAVMLRVTNHLSMTSEVTSYDILFDETAPVADGLVWADFSGPVEFQPSLMSAKCKWAAARDPEVL